MFRIRQSYQEDVDQVLAVAEHLDTVNLPADRGHIETSAERFRFQTLQSRFQTFIDLWDRGQRAREEGRPGPFFTPAAKTAGPKKPDAPESKGL